MPANNIISANRNELSTLNELAALTKACSIAVDEGSMDNHTISDCFLGLSKIADNAFNQLAERLDRAEQ